MSEETVPHVRNSCNAPTRYCERGCVGRLTVVDFVAASSGLDLGFPPMNKASILDGYASTT